MPHHFLDSSALVKRYRQEVGTERVLELCDTSDRIIVSRLAQVEVASAIVRRGRGAAVPPEHIDAALAALEEDLRLLFEVIELGTAVTVRAVDLTRAHGLRAADAIQLASALLARPVGVPSAEFILVASDQELNTAAAVEGLAVIDPMRS